MNTFKGEGKSIQYVNGSGGSISSGGVIDFGDFHGISVATIANGDTGAMRVSGEHVLPATTAGKWQAGDDLFWDDSNDKLIALGGSGYRYIGKASRSKPAGTETTARVLLNFGAVISPQMCDRVWEAIAAGTKTLNAQDVGKVMNVTQDCTVTLPATVAGAKFILRMGGLDTIVQIIIDPAGADKLIGPDYAPADGVTYINTKASAKTGDFVVLDATPDGYYITSEKGTWVEGT